MCGIAGLIGAERPDKRALVDAMLDAIAHRGPDGRGVFEDGPLVLGHLRLAIYDPSVAGDQPMLDRETGDALVFNGAIYNQRALRDGLSIQPRSSGDTECLLRLLVERGVEGTLDRLNGIWAFAYWEVGRRRLVIARDRFGVKPMFWTRWRDQIAFASEIAALLTLPGMERRIEPAALADFLTERMQSAGDGTFLRGIHRLPPASTMTLSADGIVGPGPRVYWTPGSPTASPSGSPTASPPGSVEALRALLEDAVSLRLVADVPVATMLSGGLDSTTLAALAATGEGGREVVAYTLRYGDDDPEFALARPVADKHPAIDLRVVEPGEDDFPSAMDRVTRVLGEPFADGSMIAHRAIMARVSADGFKVVLSGLGGDEALGGYVPTQALALAADHLRAGRPVAAMRAVGGTGYLARATQHALPTGLKNVLRASRQCRTWERYAAPEILAAASPRFPSKRGGGLFRSYLDAGREAWFLPGFLHYDDHNAMSVGIEARAPFLDRRVIEWGLGARPEDLVGDGIGKRVLRRLARDLLPPAVTENRVKRGLPAPAERWLLDHADFVADSLTTAARRLPGLGLGRVADLHRSALGSGRLDPAAAAIVWRSLSVAVWAEQAGATL